MITTTATETTRSPHNNGKMLSAIVPEERR